MENSVKDSFFMERLFKVVFLGFCSGFTVNEAFVPGLPTSAGFAIK